MTTKTAAEYAEMLQAKVAEQRWHEQVARGCQRCGEPFQLAADGQPLDAA